MRRVIWLCLALTLTGCGRKTPVALLAPTAAPLATVDASVRAYPQPMAHPQAARWTEQVRHGDPYVRQRAVESLGELGEEGFHALLQCLRSDAADTRLWSLRALHKPVMVAHAGETLPALARLLTDANPQIRQEALGRLDWFGATTRQAVLPRVRNVVDSDPSPEVGQVAASVYVNLHGTTAGVLRLLSDRNPLIRQHAAVYLGGLEADGQVALAPLRALAETDTHAAVRRAAADSCRTIAGAGGR